ncbi:hypothetical protein E8E13_002202 [Curvularia kusanoi]|uniref:Heterokaryon incompatibility domain-containing protein n=1 Tax=Curvularia kusanoi TaxID=90978 RepID=A0A9P4TAY1_CURKU|nr:hypothetical protein E8E13_002202 [Curvularia kusanoi]
MLLGVSDLHMNNFEARFEALSYVWGDEHAKRTVQISGYSVEVTRMLYTAFEHLRYPLEKRTLWIDQVCIDQTNDDEKSHQVSLMRTIYKKCSQCVVWLGGIPSDKGFSKLDAEVAMAFIHTMAYGRYDLSEVDPKIRTFLANDVSGKKARKAFEALIMGGNPWWSRVWTLQEASLPAEATLHWGPLCVPLETVELAARRLKATDPRDKVYSFLGLFPSTSLSNSPALRDLTYSVKSATLFSRVTVDLIRLENDLRSLIGARELPHMTPNLPTWAIDFASSSAIASKELDLRLEISEDEKTLFLSGILIDCVQKIGQVYHVSVEEEIDDKKLRESIIHSRCIMEEYQASCGRDDYVGGGTLYDAFWRTMLGNQIMGEMPQGSPKDYRAEYFEGYVKNDFSSPQVATWALAPRIFN